MSLPPGTALAGPPARLRHAVFQPIGEHGRATLVEQRIADAIVSGVLSAGERLPAETDLAASFGVAPVTIREALLSLRGRGLIVTRRGRSGGSFVADGVDPVRFATQSLVESSRAALRDAAQHYEAIMMACVDLAARRADTGEIARIRTRLDRVDDRELGAWRRACDDALIELAALSQSARLTRELMRLQGEISPLLALINTDAAARAVARATLGKLLDEVAQGNPTTAVIILRDGVSAAVTWLIDHRTRLGADNSTPPTHPIPVRSMP